MLKATCESIAPSLTNLFNPLSPNIADLQHFDTVLFCDFSLRNAFRPSTELFTESLSVVPLSQGLVEKAGQGLVHRRKQLSKQRRCASDNIDRTVQVKWPSFYAYLE